MTHIFDADRLDHRRDATIRGIISDRLMIYSAYLIAVKFDDHLYIHKSRFLKRRKYPNSIASELIKLHMFPDKSSDEDIIRIEYEGALYEIQENADPEYKDE